MSSGKVSESNPDYSTDEGQQRPLSITTDGELRVNAAFSGTIDVAGTDTPADDRPNPTTNLPVTAFNEYWNTEESAWFRVNCIDLNNQDVPASPTPFFALSTYSVSGGLDELTSLYSTFAQRSPADNMANPADDFLLPLDALSRALLFCPENSTPNTWLRARGDSLGSARTIASAPPLDGEEGAADRFGYADAAGTRGVISADPAKLLAIDMEFTTNDATTFLMFFDDDAAPNNGDTPIPGMTFACPEGFFSKFLGREHFGEAGLKCDVGLTFGFSSTAGTLTLVAVSLVNTTMNCSGRL